MFIFRLIFQVLIILKIQKAPPRGIAKCLKILLVETSEILIRFTHHGPYIMELGICGLPFGTWVCGESMGWSRS